MRHAEFIFSGGTILTCNPAAPQIEAFAVADGRILATGKATEIEALSGPGTRRIALGGTCVMPGLVESHTHAIWGACRDLFQVYVGYSASLAELAQAVRDKADRTDPGTWISGGPWRLDMRDALGMSPRAWLDQLAPAHPVALFDTSQHAAWCNSLALRAAGLDEDHPAIPGGIIEKDPAGRPTGYLAEAGCAPIRELLRETPEQLRAACDYAVRYLNSLGYTGFKEPMADEALLDAYARACDDGRLTLHAAAHLTAFSPLSAGYVAYDEIDRLRDTYSRPGLNLNFAKLFLDGVAPARTASFLEPYLPIPGVDHVPHDPDATLLIPPDRLCDMVSELDRRGYVVKMHAVGDNAARKGLDAIAAARSRNGASGLRHEIAHCTFIADADVARFAALDAVAEVSPKLWMPNAATAAQRAVLPDDTLARLHRVRDLLDAGAEVVFGSDWPASAPDADPWSGLAGLINRQDPTGRFAGAMCAQQGIGLDRALDLFTRNGARALGLAGRTSCLRQGAWADFVVLPGDIRDMPPEAIGTMAVRETFWKGRPVHAA